MSSANAPTKPVVKAPTKPAKTAPAQAEAKDTAPSSAPPPQTEAGQPTQQETAAKPDVSDAKVAAIQTEITAITDIPPGTDGLTNGMLEQVANPSATLGPDATVEDAIVVNSAVAADVQNRPTAEVAIGYPTQSTTETQPPPATPEPAQPAQPQPDATRTPEPAATAPAASRKEPEPKSQSHWTERWGLTLTEQDQQMLDRLLGSAVSTFYKNQDISGLLATAFLHSPSGLVALESVAAYMRSAGASVPPELDGFLTRPDVQTAVSEHQDRLRNAARGTVLTDTEAGQLAQEEHRSELFPTLEARIDAAIKSRNTVAVQNFLRSDQLFGENFEFSVGGILLSAGALPSDPTERNRVLNDFSKKWEKMIPSTIKEKLGTAFGKFLNAIIGLLLMMQGVQMVDQVAQSAEPRQH